MSSGRSLRYLERELFSDSIPRDRLLGYKEFKADLGLASVDTAYHADPVIEKIFRLSESARGRVNKYLTGKGLQPVDLPSYLEIKDMPEVSGFLFQDVDRNYVLPAGHVGASYNTCTDGITFYKAMVPNSNENEELIGIYKKGISTATTLMQNHHELRKPLQKLARFYDTMIRALQDPEKAEAIFVHEYGHKVAQERKNGYGESLNAQLMSAPLRKGNRRQAVEAVEGFNCLLTDDITGRETTEPGTSYDLYKSQVGRALRQYGTTPAGVLHGAYNNVGKAISNCYACMN